MAFPVNHSVDGEGLVELLRSDVKGSFCNPVRHFCKGVEVPLCSEDDDTGSLLRFAVVSYEVLVSLSELTGRRVNAALVR